MMCARQTNGTLVDAATRDACIQSGSTLEWTAEVRAYKLYTSYQLIRRAWFCIQPPIKVKGREELVPIFIPHIKRKNLKRTMSASFRAQSMGNIQVRLGMRARYFHTTYAEYQSCMV